MKKGILLGLALALMVLGTAIQSSAQEGPVIDKVFVTPQINHGELLKIYVIGHSNADMRWVQVSGGKGKGGISGGVTRLKKADRRNLNGYLYWDTGKAVEKDVTGTIEITLVDRQGRESETASVTLKIRRSGVTVQAPPSEFKEKEIGPVMIDPVDLTTH